MKKAINICLEEEDERALRSMCEIIGIPMSRLFQEAARGYVAAAKASGLLNKKKASVTDLIKLFGKGMLQEV